jgi:uracil phosphoribosyltransferase
MKGGCVAQTKIIDHPLVACHLTVLRDRSTPSVIFRQSIDRLATLLAYEATENLETVDVEVQTPLQQTRGKKLKRRIGLVPILRAGIGMVEPMLDLIPNSEVWHLGFYRDEVTAQPVHYYSKLAARFPVDVAFVLDPMLATGGSACMACQSLVEWGVPQIKMLSIIATPEGIARLNAEFPEVEIHTCIIDEGLNQEKFIVPGLGDAGDRIFNTEVH